MSEALFASIRNVPSRLLCCWIVVVLVGQRSAGEVQAEPPPNIVVYLSDDHSQCDSSLYGNANIPTPNFEKLADEGVTFTHAFVASPSCAPSRGAMLTGLMPARNGAEANHTFPKPGTHVLVKDLQALGYEVVAFGKVAHGKRHRFGFDLQKPETNLAKLRRNVGRFLDGRDSTKPLCLFVGVSEPHVPWSSPSSFHPEAVEFPPVHFDTPSTREHRAAYYEEIKALDAFLGDLRKTVDRQLGSNVLFIHTSDHGSQWPFGKWTLYDYGIRVPFIASWPGKIEPGRRCEAMISWIDLLPTLIEVGGGKPPSDIDGRSFAVALLGEKQTHRDLIFTTHTGDGSLNVYPCRSVRSRHWKLIHNLHPEYLFTNHSDLHRKPNAGAYWTEWLTAAATDARAESLVQRYYQRPEYELYDLREDSWEENNLANDEEHRQRFQELKHELQQWMKSQGDEGNVIGSPRLVTDKESWPPELKRTLAPTK